MINELKLSSEMPLTKNEIDSLSSAIISPIIDGEVDPSIYIAKLKAMQESIKKVLDDDRVKDAVINEVEKYGKSREWNGAILTLKESTRYDFSACGDPIHSDLMRQKDRLEEQIKKRESFLKTVPDNTTILDEETGEIMTIHPAVRLAKSVYSITFKKSI